MAKKKVSKAPAAPAAPVQPVAVLTISEKQQMRNHCAEPYGLMSPGRQQLFLKHKDKLQVLALDGAWVDAEEEKLWAGAIYRVKPEAKAVTDPVVIVETPVLQAIRTPFTGGYTVPIAEAADYDAFRGYRFADGKCRMRLLKKYGAPTHVLFERKASTNAEG